MAKRVTCPSCGKTGVVADDRARTVQCNRCRHVFDADAGNRPALSEGKSAIRPASSPKPAVSPVGHPLPEAERRLLRLTFDKIVTNDVRRSPTPLPRTELDASLPTWLDREAHEFEILMVTLDRVGAAIAARDVDDTFMQAVVVFEYVAGSASMFDDRQPIAATQQIADAWFHKATIYMAIADAFPDDPGTRGQYLRAAAHCVDRAESNPRFIQPAFTECKAALVAKIKAHFQSRP